MLPSFNAEISGGKILVPELAQRESFMEGRHIAISVLELNNARQVVGGKIYAGVLKEGTLVDADGNEVPLKELEGSQVIVTMRHNLMGRISPDAFDERFQLGAKPGDVDD